MSYRTELDHDSDEGEAGAEINFTVDERYKVAKKSRISCSQ